MERRHMPSVANSSSGVEVGACVRVFMTDPFLSVGGGYQGKSAASDGCMCNMVY